MAITKMRFSPPHNKGARGALHAVQAAGIYAAAWQNVTGYLAADEMTSLKPNSSGS
jgi:hypothetical protein